jgi:cell division transport system permease protein
MLRESDLVTEYEFVSKEDALARFARDFVELASVVDQGGGNPMPASFEAVSGVDDVRFDQRWIERLTTAVGVVRVVGLAVVLVLVVAAALTVANVVRLSCVARSDEIEIMRLVGAPLTFVRGPFVLEGILQGGGVGRPILACGRVRPG